MALAREAPAEALEEAVDAVEPAGAGEEHERALPVHDLDPPLAAERDGLRAHRPRPAAAVHPDPLHAGLGALADHLVGRRRWRHQQGRLGRGLDLAHAARGRAALHLAARGVHRDGVVAALDEGAEDLRLKSFGSRDTPTTAMRRHDRKESIACFDAIGCSSTSVQSKAGPMTVAHEPNGLTGAH